MPWISITMVEQVYVFYCLWQDRLKTGEQPRIGDHWDDRLVGLESVLLGERNLGQQTLEIVISGYASPEKAEARPTPPDGRPYSDLAGMLGRFESFFSTSHADVSVRFAGHLPQRPGH